jgi:hypothetical protein
VKGQFGGPTTKYACVGYVRVHLHLPLSALLITRPDIVSERRMCVTSWREISVRPVHLPIQHF